MRGRLCSLDSGSYVDTLSNLAFIDGLTAWSALEGIAQGTLPSEILPVFFHEATHHWTLHSQVGTALSIAKISAAWAMFGGKSAPSGVSPGDYAKYLAGGTFLRAWSEGLAQFAEFDVVSGGARSTTFATHLIQWLYCLQDAERGNVEQAVNQRLAAVRTTGTMVDRKANALRQPFAASTGGYLPGYLAVKRLAGRLRAAGGPFEDADFILSYLKAFVFDDPVATGMFLDLDGNAFVTKYFDHLGYRFAQLLERSDEELRRAAIEFDDFVASEPRSEDDIEGKFLPGLFVERSQYEDAFLTLLRRFEHLGVLSEPSPSAPHGPENVLERFYRAISFQRRFLCLASSDVPVADVRDARLTTGEAVVLTRTPQRNTYMLGHWNRERYVDLDAIEALEIDSASPRPINTPGLRLEVWIDPIRVRAFACLHSTRAQVGIRSLIGPCRSEDLPWDVFPRDEALQVIDQIDRALPEKSIRAHDGAPATSLGDATAALEKQIFTDVDNMLAWLAFPLSHAEQIGPMLATKGLGALASYSPDGLRGLSLLTLADVAGQAADNVCDKVQLPRSCLVLASGLVDDMEKLGWHARSADTWVV